MLATPFKLVLSKQVAETRFRSGNGEPAMTVPVLTLNTYGIPDTGTATWRDCIRECSDCHNRDNRAHRHSAR